MCAKQNYQYLLREPTVLFLGAGASAPYGLPTGSGLWTELKRWASQSESYAYLTRYNLKQNDIRSFLDALRFQSNYQTIDQFLEAKPSQRQIGCLAITATLLRHESYEKLLAAPAEDWYSDLLDGLCIDEEKSANLENLTIVSLNYDRSLEYYLARKIELHVPDSIIPLAQDRISKIKFLHPHGSLGLLRDVGYGGMNSLNDEVVQAANRLRFPFDSLNDHDDFITAKRAISEATYLVFLGFGYHSHILTALLEKSPTRKQSAFGTAFNLNSDRIEAIKRAIGRNLVLGHPAHHCREFMRSMQFKQF